MTQNHNPHQAGKYINWRQLCTPGVALALIAALQLALLSTVLYMPNPDFILQIPPNFDRKSATDVFLVKLLMDLRAFNDTIWFGKKSMELARTLKSRALFIEDREPREAEEYLKRALAIEQAFESSNISFQWQSFNAMEIADTADKLASVLEKRGDFDEAVKLQEKTYELIKQNRLLELYPLAEKYRDVLLKRGKTKEAKLVSAQIHLWKIAPEANYLYYMAARKQVFLQAQAEHRTSPALSYLAEYFRSMGLDFALEDRIDSARPYYERCLNISKQLPRSLSQPTDLAELALVYLQLDQFKNAEEKYNACVQQILESDNPDVVMVLPQFQGVADLYSLMNKKEDAVLATRMGQDIVNFLEQLKGEKMKPASANNSWKEDDLVQAYLDEVWWSGRVVGTRAKQSRVHLIGLADSQDEWVANEMIRTHPPYGYAALQSQVPECISITNH